MSGFPCTHLKYFLFTCKRAISRVQCITESAHSRLSRETRKSRHAWSALARVRPLVDDIFKTLNLAARGASLDMRNKRRFNPQSESVECTHGDEQEEWRGETRRHLDRAYGVGGRIAGWDYGGMAHPPELSSMSLGTFSGWMMSIVSRR